MGFQDLTIQQSYISCGENNIAKAFILSTNEEINSDHVTIMKDRIAATYMLENSDNKRTIVASNSYFEV